MKRFLVLGSYLLVLTTLAAQVNLSLDLGYSNKSYRCSVYQAEAYDGSLPKGMSCQIAPRLGFQINDDVAVGIQLGMLFSDYDYTEGFYNSEYEEWQRTATTSNRMIAAMARGYMRIRCFTVGDWSLHAEIAGEYSRGWGRENRSEVRFQSSSEVVRLRHTTSHTFCAQVLPVASYSVSRRVEVDLYLNLAAVTYTSTTTELWPSYTSGSATEEVFPEKTTTTHDFDIGLNSLNTSLISIGFRYVF